jgi:dUTP pyrophosphatase
MNPFKRNKSYDPTGYDYLSEPSAHDIEVGVKLLTEDAVLPTYAKDGDAGFDLYAAHDAFISPGSTVLVKTGLAFELPDGFEIQVRPRSGNSMKTKMRVANSPGTVDSGYRGEVGVIIDNTDDVEYGRPIHIQKGDRIAQGVLQRVPRAKFIVKSELSKSERGDGGFGSTGK